MRSLIWTSLLLLFVPVAAQATPSTQIWIPSTDIQPFGVFHLNYDAYVHLRDDAPQQRKPAVLDLGPTVGVLPFQKVQLEVGFDLVFQGVSALDRSPLYLNAKLGTPEDSIFHGSPALALGIEGVGFSRGLTDQNVGYGLVSRTIPIFGRASVGYYLGNSAVLLNATGHPDNRGLLLSWDRKLEELTPKLWAAVDYQSGRNGLSALNGGIAWSFTDDISIIGGYDHYLDRTVAGADSFTVQLDMNMH